MTAAAFFELFHQYGLLLVCGVIFCEYMNLPGFPAGVIMPCIGVLIAQSSLSLPLTQGALAALRHILYCPDKKLYSFTLERPALRQLDHAAEALTAAQLERSFRTLDYYKSILPQEEPTYD